MEVCLILDNRLVKNYEFTKKEKKLRTLDDFIYDIQNKTTNNISKKEVKALDRWIGSIKLKNKKLYRALIFFNCIF